MKTILKWIGIVLAGLVVVLLIAAVVLYISGSSRVGRTHDIQVEAIDIPTDAVAIERGRHLAEAVTLCMACHGDNMEGQVEDDNAMILTFAPPNLTAGEGGAGGELSVADLVRAIRHGVNREGRGLLIMHSDIFHNLSEEDLGAIIAYVRSVPPVDNEIPKTKVGPLGRVFLALGMFDSGTAPPIPAEVIDHSAPFAAMPPEGVTVEYGRYLMSISLCTMCHGADLQGAPPVDPSMPPGPNIAAYADAGGWTAEQFISTIRTGVTPYGRTLDPEFMPWDIFSKMTDEELSALWLYVQSLAE